MAAMETGPDFFDLKPLPPEEKGKYMEMGKSWLPQMLKLVNQTKADGWSLCSNKNGVKIMKKVSPGNPVVMIRGQSVLTGYTLAEASPGIKSLTNTERLRTALHAVDPMNIDSQSLHVIHKGETPRDPDPVCQILWAAFEAPPTIWSRDFCWLQYIDTVKDENGREGIVACSQSIPFDQCRSLEKSHKFVRGQLIQTGYCYTVSDENPNDLIVTYIVQLDPKGSIPKWVVNTVAANQGQNAGRVRDNAIEMKNILKKFNNHHLRQNPRNEKLIGIDLDEILVYKGNHFTHEYIPEATGKLQVMIYPTGGSSIILKGEEFQVDDDSDIPPIFECFCEKGISLELKFINNSTGMMDGKFKHVWFYASMVSDALTPQSPLTSNAVSADQPARKRGGIFAKLTWSGSKRKKRADLHSGHAQAPQIRVVEKIVEVEKFVEIHLEKREKLFVFVKGFALCFAVVLLAACVGVKTHHLKVIYY